jgi:Zn-dependent protease
VNGDLLLQRAMLLVPLVLSLSVHEFAHAWSASRLGDDTAARMGRLTLNPLAHIDLFGTVLLPLLGIPFGWAKPVPVNPARFRRGISMGTGMMITASAGPLSNVILAVLATVALGLVYRVAPQSVAAAAGPSAVRDLLAIVIQMNVALAIFNLIPVPPLDGSRVLDGLMPHRLRPAWESFTRFAPFLLLFVFIGARYIMAGPMDAAYHLLDRLLEAVAT